MGVLCDQVILPVNVRRSRGLHGVSGEISYICDPTGTTTQVCNYLALRGGDSCSYKYSEKRTSSRWEHVSRHQAL